jgi:hypothetical protein
LCRSNGVQSRERTVLCFSGLFDGGAIVDHQNWEGMKSGMTNGMLSCRRYISPFILRRVTSVFSFTLIFIFFFMSCAFFQVEQVCPSMSFQRRPMPR